MKTVAAIYTAISIIEPIKALFSELMPGHRLVNVYDDSLIPDVISAGNSVTTDIRRRLLAYCRATEDMGADLIEEGRRSGEPSKLRLGLEKIENANRQLDQLEKR